MTSENENPALNDGFDQPRKIPAAQRAFPADVIGTLLPLWDDIPEEFRSDWTGQHGNEWTLFVNRLFGLGWPLDREVLRRDDVDPEIAYQHLDTILRSYQPKHEHKIAGVAWLMSRWFLEIRPKAAS